MSKETSDKQEVWKTIILFLGILTALSSVAYYAILKLNPTSIYIGGLMLSPAIASFITLKIRKRSVASLPWSLKELKYLKSSYITPILYVTIAYVLIWIFGYGSFINSETLTEWSNELGIDESRSAVVIITMTFLLLTVGVIKNIGSTLGEEIGWRGFLIFELRKVMPFRSVALLSGGIWALWHWPIIHLIFGSSEYLALHLAAFSSMIIGISVILAYFTFKSNSLWPAALYHSVHNIYVQKICSPLSIANDNTVFWIDEYGIMIPIVTSIFAIYYFRKASLEKL